jgi:hypothetical protein
MNTVSRVLANIPPAAYSPDYYLQAPHYSPTHQSSNPTISPPEEVRVGLAVEDMKRHMTDEGWQLFSGLQYNGYQLAGYNLTYNCTNVCKVVEQLKPTTVVLQDRREWDVEPRNFREKRARFTEVDTLRYRPEIFKLTVVKDAQHNPWYHRESAESIGCHAWIIYYHPSIVCTLAPYVRRRHTVRTYHSVDADICPYLSFDRRKGCLLSGAVSNAYPLRHRLITGIKGLYNTEYLKHPGYHNKGSHTPAFLHTLSKYKVAICTASRYGYALRKLMEATACGCRVITDLPTDEVLPEIDDNLIRVDPDSTVNQVNDAIQYAIQSYEPDRQAYFAGKARTYYDYRAVGMRLTKDIQLLKQGYNR